MNKLNITLSTQRKLKPSTQNHRDNSNNKHDANKTNPTLKNQCKTKKRRNANTHTQHKNVNTTQTINATPNINATQKHKPNFTTSTQDNYTIFSNKKHKYIYLQYMRCYLVI